MHIRQYFIGRVITALVLWSERTNTVGELFYLPIQESLIKELFSFDMHSCPRSLQTFKLGVKEVSR